MGILQPHFRVFHITLISEVFFFFFKYYIIATVTFVYDCHGAVYHI